MAITPAVLAPGSVLGTASAALYTAPAGTRAVVKRAVFSNITATSQSITVTVTRSGGSAVTIISAQAVPGNSTYLAPELSNLVLAPGDALGALSSAAASINAFASGFTL